VRRTDSTIGPVDTKTVWCTERLMLRRFTAADEDALVELNSDPEVMRFLTGGRPPSREAVRTRMLPEFLAYPSSVLGTWAASTRDGEFLGWLGLRVGPDGPGLEAPGLVGPGPAEAGPDGPGPDGPGPAETGPELGYRLRRAAWGRGYATEGSRALVDRAFAETDTGRIWATTMAVNTRSRRVLERVGLRHVRTYHEHFEHPIAGTEHGEVEYAITRSEWQRGRPA
jgi:RimJ/RimL family protein N-acetyltransferase